MTPAQPTSRQPWLGNASRETWLILAPSLLPVAAVLIFQKYFTQHEVTSLWWIVLVLCIDVSHVYSTLFRLYWDRPTFRQYKKMLIVIPVVAFIAGAALHFYNAGIFWRVLAYIAVYHFIRQQYGFMRLYSRQEKAGTWIRLIDSAAIYNATVYPLLYWHLHLTQQLNWFVKGDFIPLPGLPIDPILTAIFAAIIILYCIKEVVVSYRNRLFNIPKNMIMAGTYLSWYVGIITFQGDLIFTLLNVVAHGIPYMGLIWIHGEKKAASTFSFGIKGIAMFVVVLLVLAYTEETFWDVFVWKDHPDIFPFFTQQAPLESPVLLSIIVPLLVLPQLTHYVLDGFIWRFSKDKHANI